jgi:hypothetical protein
MSNYAPKNRPEDNGGLTHLDIDITSAIGKDRYDPNTVIEAAQEGHLAALPPVDGLQSDISGEPAVLYRTGEIRLQLTPAELQRLTLHTLEPHEVFALVKMYGEFFEVDEGFYDMSNGNQMQPNA